MKDETEHEAWTRPARVSTIDCRSICDCHLLTYLLLFNFNRVFRLSSSLISTFRCCCVLSYTIPTEKGTTGLRTHCSNDSGYRRNVVMLQAISPAEHKHGIGLTIHRFVCVLLDSIDFLVCLCLCGRLLGAFHSNPFILLHAADSLEIYGFINWHVWWFFCHVEILFVRMQLKLNEVEKYRFWLIARRRRGRELNATKKEDWRQTSQRIRAKYTEKLWNG